MAESSPTVAEIYKAKTITDDDESRLVRAVLDGETLGVTCKAARSTS